MNPADFAMALIHYRWRWILPMLLVTAAALTYAVCKPSMWEANQALVLRDEAISSLGNSGEFEQLEDMKHAQETVMQLARSRDAVTAALQELGPPAGLWDTANWPTKEDIASVRKSISVHSPGGTEFGTTEILYLSVEASSPERAKKLNQIICSELEKQLGEMRNRRAKSLVQELTYRHDEANRAVMVVTQQLSELESSVGTDLAELRLLNEVGSGNGNLREQIVQIKSEFRKALDDQQSSQQLLEILTAADGNPSELIATPNRLLESQPALRRLKDGLIDAQLRTAQLQGTRTADHPSVVAALQAEQGIRSHLHQEIAVAIRGLNAEKSVNQSRIDQLQNQLEDVGNRMTQLASLRAGYENLVRDVNEKNRKLSEIRSSLAEAKSSVQTAKTTSLVTKVSQAEVSDYPVGPSRKIIAASGLIGGLALGLGIVLLSIPSAASDQTGQSPQTSTGSDGKSTTPSPSHGLSLKDALTQLARRSPSRN